MENLVSVIVPIYNVEEYLDRCLESIVNQTYSHLEIILVDDGSQDACPRKCDEWTEKDERIKVIHKKNEGAGLARNSGLDIATGNLIAFVDSDDYLPLNIIEIMISRMEDEKSDIAIAQSVKVYLDGTKGKADYSWLSNRTITKEEAYKMLGSAQALPVYPWGKLYRKHIFSKIRYLPLKCAEDVYILPDIIEQCEKISLIGSVGYFYFQRSNSIVHTKKIEQMLDDIKASLKMARFLFEHNEIEGASRYYYSAVCKYYETKNNPEVKIMLKCAFDKQEKKVLHKGRDRKMVLAMMIAKFPKVYNFYKSRIKRKK